jgi:hypothetical protein
LGGPSFKFYSCIGETYKKYYFLYSNEDDDSIKIPKHKKLKTKSQLDDIAKKSAHLTIDEITKESTNQNGDESDKKVDKGLSDLGDISDADEIDKILLKTFSEDDSSNIKSDSGVDKKLSVKSAEKPDKKADKKVDKSPNSKLKAKLLLSSSEDENKAEVSPKVKNSRARQAAKQVTDFPSTTSSDKLPLKVKIGLSSKTISSDKLLVKLGFSSATNRLPSCEVVLDRVIVSSAVINYDCQNCEM